MFPKKIQNLPLNNATPSANNQPTEKTSVKTTFFYINDIHGQMSKLDKIKYAADSFNKAFENDKSTDTFKLSAGDMMIGKEPNKNNIMIDFLNMIGIEYSAIGNHEFDCGVTNMINQFKKANFKFLSSNLLLNGNKPLQQAMNDNKVVESAIVEKNGHKYGLIGASPMDIEKRLSDVSALEGTKVMDLEQTAAKLQKEIDNLKQQGINKIILTSHIGYDMDLKLASMLDGVDIIIGGHSHTKVEGLDGQRNIVESKSGEPVIVLQTGKDGENFGVLSTEFDKDGIITEANNVLLHSKEFPKSPEIDAVKDKYLGKARQIGTLTATCDPQNVIKTENPLTNLIADGIKMKSGAQVVLINSRNIRGMLEKGPITNRNIQELSPFKNALYKVEISEKDLIDALNQAAKSLLDPDCRPGLTQVSGMKYKVDMFKNVKEASLINADGTETPINCKNPNPNKKITAVYDQFLFNGKEGYTMLKDKPVLEKYEWDKPEGAIELIEKTYQGKPFELKPDGRVIVEASPAQEPPKTLAELLTPKKA